MKMESAERKETELPVIGGALNIVCGVVGLIGGIVLLIISYLGEELGADPIGIAFLVVLGIVPPSLVQSPSMVGYAQSEERNLDGQS